MSEIEQALARIFERYRIVVWYDAKQELQVEFGIKPLPQIVVDSINQCVENSRNVRTLALWK